MDTDFPLLSVDGYTQTSPETKDYNCIAWAAGDTNNWWWPDESQTGFWPEAAARALTLGAFLEAFGTVGYRPCGDGDYDPASKK